MDTKELKFLLKLLGCENYRSLLSKIKPNDKTTATERDRICSGLQKRDLVDCSYEVTKLKISSAGQALLEVEKNELPLSKLQLKVLQACQKGEISPGKTGVAPAERQEIIQSLADRGLIEVQQKVKEVWICEHGLEYLRDEYTAKGSQAVLTLDMMNNYLRFLRKTLPDKCTQASSDVQTAQEPAVQQAIHITDEDVLAVVRELDQDLGTDNYLPIFHLRHKLQPPLSRDELDQALYRLQKNDQIELSTLQEANAFTEEQINAGIHQNIGGPLFFISIS